ncbi:MAG: hypothetical protein MI861_04750 [Pirellulales bacterium]|nr:hypothetical protein [Pirellulales bacterium]
MLAYSAKKHSPAWDEAGHLAAGISHWQLSRLELYSINPPLVRNSAAECEECQSGYVIEKGNRFAGSLLVGVPVPLPANYLPGIDVQTRDFSNRGSPA